jgi:predicted ATPase
MWIESMTFKNIRSFADAQINLSQGINILVGPNNSGKSTILLPLLSLQDGLRGLFVADVRLGENESRADIHFGECDEGHFQGAYQDICLEFIKGSFDLRELKNPAASSPRLPQIPNTEPHNFIYPFLSKRKVTQLQEKITEPIVSTVSSSFENLNAKIDRLSNPVLPAHKRYMRACEDILGLPITTTSTDQGKRAVFTVGNMEHIPLLSMGEGVMNVLGLVVNLVVAKNKLFLIEEPENDIHPKALKALLELIAEKSENNQFIITTHSNIVLKRLASEKESQILRIDYELRDRLPTSNVTEVPATPEARRDLLQELGYEFYDLDLWEAWLFLEESSAETIIREYLIPWFTPSLQTRLRSYSARSLSELAPKFADFNNLFVFLHLEEIYKNRVWVLVDDGDEEAAIINELKTTYSRSDWTDDHFLQLGEHDFESYYPDRFEGQRKQALGTQDKQDRREAKKKLLKDVQEWVEENDEEAKSEFETSAATVIAILRTIEAELLKQG